MGVVNRVGTEFLVNSQTARGQSHTQAAQLSNSNFVISWIDEANWPVADSIKVQIFDATGAKVGGELVVAGGLPGPATPWYSVTALSDGRFVILFEGSGEALADASGYAIKAQMFDPSGTKLGGEFLVNSATTGDQRYPSVTGTANGGFVASWTDYGTGDTKAQQFGANGTKIGGELTVNSQVTGSQSDVALTALSDGGYVATWVDWNANSDGSGSSIKAQRFDAGGNKVGGELQVNSSTTGSQTEPSAAALNGGGFVVTWSDTTGGDIRAQVYAASGALIGEEILANNSPLGSQHGPTVAGLGNGTFVIAWFNDSGTNIKAQLFAANGTKIGIEFLANTITNNSQYLPTVSAVGEDGFVIGWTSEKDLNGDTNIKAQLFSVDMAQALFAPVITSNGGQASAIISVTENSTVVTTVAATDTDSPTLAYSITGGADAALFAIDASTGQLRFKTAPDFELPADADHNNVYKVTVGVSDGGRVDSQNLSVTVTDVHEGLTLIGGVGADQLYGGDENDSVSGLGGNDMLVGGNGNDTLIGGAGNDIVFAGEGDDIIRYTGALNAQGAPANGFDVVDGETGYDRIVATAKGTIMGFQSVTGVEQISAVGFANVVIQGDGLANEFHFENVELVGIAAIKMGAGNDIVTGSAGDDYIYGQGGNDRISGGVGADRIYGGQGLDSLTGGAGADMFIFTVTSDSSATYGVDVIMDFNRSEGDRIDLSGIDANTKNGAAINDTFSFIGTDAFHRIAGELRYAQNGAGVTVTGDVNGDGMTDFVVKLAGMSVLVGSDFIL